MRTAIYRVGIGLYVLWLLATVLFILGQFTPVPVLPQAHTAVVIGAAVLTVIGAVQIVRDGYRRVSGLLAD